MCFSRRKSMLKEESYYNDKWKKAPIIYSGRALRTKDERIGVDVKSFILPNDEILKKITRKYKLKKRNHDDTALAIQKWVVNYLTYKYDKDSSDCPEFWQFPFESIASKLGDCEDFAILIASLCRNADIPAFRIKVAAGYVQASKTAPKGGHAYAIYLASDGDWRILDGCYYQDSHIKMLKKPLAKNGGYNNCYKDVWFTFNDEYSWNQKSLKVSNRISNNSAKDSSNTLQETVEIIKDKDLFQE
jgi:hypothetical protein